MFFTDKISVHDISYSVEKNKDSYSQKTINDQKQREQDSDIYNRAISEKNSTICQQIIESTMKVACEEMLMAINAVEKNDISLCSTIKNQEILAQCKDRLALKLAEEKQDSKICKSITQTGSRQYCQESIDEKRLNVALENGTIDSAFCKTLESKSGAICNETLAQKEAQKTYTKAVQNGNSASCDLIPVESERTLCLDTLALRKAVSE